MVVLLSLELVEFTGLDFVIQGMRSFHETAL